MFGKSKEASARSRRARRGPFDAVVGLVADILGESF